MDPTISAVIITIIVIVSYLTEIVPLPITAMLSCLAMVVFGVSAPAVAFSGFGSDIIMLVAGMMIVGDALFETGAALFIGSKIVKAFGKNEKTFVLACTGITIVLSAFLSNAATAAMMYPIMAAAINSSNGKLTKKNTYMSIGFAAIAGGGLTLIGSTPQLIAQGVLQEGGFETASFFEYSKFCIPLVLILLVYFLTIGYQLGKKVFDFDEIKDDVIDQKENGSNNKITPKMLISALTLLGCVVGFISGIWSLGTVAMLGGVLCIITGCISLKDVFRKLDWGTILIVAGSLGYANCLDESGAGKAIANFASSVIGTEANPIIVLSVIGLVAVILGNIMTHTATSAILLPIVVFIAQSIGIDVKYAVMITVVFINVTYSTPIMTPAVTLSLAAGYRFKDYVKVGGLLNVISYFAVVIMLLIIFGI